MMKLSELRPVLRSSKINLMDSQTKKAHFFSQESVLDVLNELYGDREVECLVGAGLMELAISLK